MGIYNKLFWFSIIITSISAVVLIFSIFIFELLIKATATSSAVLDESNANLWADIPGKTKVDIYRKHFFYNIDNPSKLISGEETANTTEIGPYSVLERQKLINRNYTNDGNVVYYNLFRYLDKTNNSLPLSNKVRTLNLVRIYYKLNLPSR